MEDFREAFQTFVRKFGLLSASCCERCCGEEVSLVQSHILQVVRALGAPSIQQVAKELGIDLTTFSRQVKRLETKGLLARRPSEDDRRVSLLGLTEEGSRVLGQIDGYFGDTMERLFSSLSEFEREIVAKSVSLLNGAMGAAPCCSVAGNGCIQQAKHERKSP